MTFYPFEIVGMAKGGAVGRVETVVSRDGRTARVVWRLKDILVIQPEGGIAEPRGIVSINHRHKRATYLLVTTSPVYTA
jgi:hypothetical protein